MKDKAGTTSRSRASSAYDADRRNVRVKSPASSDPTSAANSHDSQDSRDASLADRRVARMVAVARFMDGAYVVPGLGIRVGWDAIAGLAAGVGDVASAGAALYLVYEAHKLGAPRKTLAFMTVNVALDCVIGLVPGLGDIVDAAFKANYRNMRMLGVTINAKGGHTWNRPQWVRDA